MSTEPATQAPLFVTLLGRKHAVTMPDFAAREDVIVRYGATSKKGGVPLLRCYAAALGLCTRLGRESGADFAACSYDILGYGGQVYSYLREQGCSAAQIAEAALPVVAAIGQATYPRQKDLDEAEKN